MVDISLCMIVKDEEETLFKCLSGVTEFIDEIIIVDTGSTDKTKEIAKKFNSKIYDYKWNNNFSDARNFAFSKATKDFILWLDADDYIDENNIKKFLDLKERLTIDIDSVVMKYSLSRNEKDETIYFSKRNRLVKRENNFKWIGSVHEYLEVYGNTIHEDIYINHDKKKEYTDRNLNIFLKMEEDKIEFSGRDLFYYGNELKDNGLTSKAIEVYYRFLNKGEYWEGDYKKAIINIISLLDDSEAGKREKIRLLFEAVKKYEPNSEICSLIGNQMLALERYKDAIFWYKGALNMEPNHESLEFKNEAYSTWIPAINLCVAYSNLGDYKNAYYYNELCFEYGGNLEKVNYNRKFLMGKIRENKIKIGKLKKKLEWE